MTDGRTGAEPDRRAGRDRAPTRMPLVIRLTALISALAAGCWLAGGVVLLASPSSLPRTSEVLVLWVAGVAAGVAANVAVVRGVRRRAGWARWLVAMQALVMIVLLSVTQHAAGAVVGTVALGIHCVLITMPAANDWFASPPPSGSASSVARGVPR